MTMITTRKRLCLIYLGPTLCIIGILYTMFYTEYKLPHMIKRMQNNIGLNKNKYIGNQTDGKEKQFTIFGSYDSNEDSKKHKDDSFEEEEGNLLDECQIWIPIKEQSFISETVASPINSDQTFLKLCSVESALRSLRSDEESKTKVCLLIDRYDKFLKLPLNNGNQSNPGVLDFDVNSFHNMKIQKWYKSFRKSYNNKLILTIPDYATVFSGNLVVLNKNY